MSSQNLPRVSAFGGTLALCLSASIPGVSAEPLSLAVEQARYGPIQSINYVIGTKAVSGFFVAQANRCLVTLMIIEHSDPEAPLAQSAARVRVTLSPGQVAGLDSEEGRSLNFTCADRAVALLVEAGEREVLVARQAEQQRLLAAVPQPTAATIAAEKN